MNQTISKPTLESLLELKDFKSMLNALSYKALRSSYRFHTSHPLVSKADLLSEGITAACSAYKNYDPSKGAWCSYTYMYVQNAMQTYCKKFCHSLSITEKDSRDNLADLTSIGVLHIDQQLEDGAKFDLPVGSGIEVGENEIDEFYFRGFSSFETSLLKEHILEEKTLQEIAIKYKMSKSSVYTVVARLLERMKERIDYYESQD